jgi:hypothetical protein
MAARRFVIVTCLPALPVCETYLAGKSTNTAVRHTRAGYLDSSFSSPSQFAFCGLSDPHTLVVTASNQGCSESPTLVPARILGWHQVFLDGCNNAMAAKANLHLAIQSVDLTGSTQATCGTVRLR